jgi:hypothetical protein
MLLVGVQYNSLKRIVFVSAMSIQTPHESLLCSNDDYLSHLDLNAIQKLPENVFSQVGMY